MRSHLPAPAAARRHAATLGRADAARQIECPLSLVRGKPDRLVPWQDAGRIAAEARGPVERLIVPDGDHFAHDRPYRYRMQTADWTAARLGLPRQQAPDSYTYR